VNAVLASIACVLASFFAILACAETVDVKYRGPVDLVPFTCQNITRSSFINRVCYDESESYMLIELDGTY
jgi:hypothetical protein